MSAYQTSTLSSDDDFSIIVIAIEWLFITLFYAFLLAYTRRQSFLYPFIQSKFEKILETHCAKNELDGTINTFHWFQFP